IRSDSWSPDAAPGVRRTLSHGGAATPAARVGRTETSVTAAGPAIGEIGRMGEARRLGQDQRLTFRVTVRGSVDFDAWLLLAGKKLAAAVGDISAEGMFMALARGPIAALKVGSKVEVILEFEGETIV